MNDTMNPGKICTTLVYQPIYLAEKDQLNFKTNLRQYTVNNHHDNLRSSIGDQSRLNFGTDIIFVHLRISSGNDALRGVLNSI